MNPYLKAGIKTVAVVWLIAVYGCIPAMKGVCRHDATYALHVAGEKYPVRVAGGDRQGELHAQAQAWIDGKWQWLCVDHPEVYVCGRDALFVEKVYFPPDIWLKFFVEKRLIYQKAP